MYMYNVHVYVWEQRQGPLVRNPLDQCVCVCVCVYVCVCVRANLPSEITTCMCIHIALLVIVELSHLM